MEDQVGTAGTETAPKTATEEESTFGWSPPHTKTSASAEAEALLMLQAELQALVEKAPASPPTEPTATWATLASKSTANTATQDFK